MNFKKTSQEDKEPKEKKVKEPREKKVREPKGDKTKKRAGKLLKALSRGNLYGHYGPLMGAALIVGILPMLIMFPFNKILDIQISNLLTVILAGEAIEWPKVIIYYVIQLVVTAFTSVLGIGVYKMHLDLARGKRIEFMNLLYGFSSNTLQCVILSVAMMLLNNIFTWPGMICQAVATIYDGDVKLVLNIVGLVLLLAGAIVMIVITVGVSMAYFTILEAECSAFAALKKSYALMKGNKLRYVGLVLSFLGWMFIGICSAGIGFLWIAPYMQQTKTMFYMDISGELDDVLAQRAANEHK